MIADTSFLIDIMKYDKDAIKKAEFSHKKGGRRWFAVDYRPVLVTLPPGNTVRYYYVFYCNDRTLFWDIRKRR